MKKEKKRKIYLDHNATTPLHHEVKKMMREAMEIFGNPSSLHEYGRSARDLVEQSRKSIAGFIGADAEEIIFTGSGSEANNTVFNLLSCRSQCEATSRPQSGKNEIITSGIEHPCVLETLACMGERGLKVRFVPVNRAGEVDLRQLEAMICDKTLLVSIMTANNEVGTIQDVARIAGICHGKGVLFHTDAVQAVGKIPFNVGQVQADYVSFSAHKIYGPKGIGGLYVRKGSPFCSFIHGGHQEKGRRAGTENTLGIAGFGKAVELRAQEMEAEAKRLLELKRFLREGIARDIPDVLFNGHQEKSIPGTLHVSFPGAEGEALLLYLDLEGIAVSTGSACASGSLDPSHVLIACGLPAEQAHGSIRISMGRDTNKEDMEYTLRALTRVVSRVRGISSVYK